jgi:hypothetical protein
MIDDWAELEALIVELREANERWRNTNETLQKQLESFREVTEQIEQHFDGLAVYDSLLTLSSRVLNDAARVHTGRLNYGLTLSAAMVWYAMDDPRLELADASPEGSYTIEVRIGPRYLLGVERDAGASSDQRMSVLIAGEKQLVATLPTTPEKFRAALLRAFTAPHYSGPPRETTPSEAMPAEGSTSEADAEGTAGVQPESADASTPPADSVASPDGQAAPSPAAEAPPTAKKRRTKRSS